MKIKKSSSKVKTVIVIAIALTLFIGATTYAFREQLGLTSSEETEVDVINYSEPTPEEKTGENTAEQPNESEDSTPPTSDDAALEDIEVTISSVSQDGSNLRIRTMIRPLVADGSCILTLSKVNETPVTQTADLQNMPSYSMCQGFDVDTLNLTPGRWDIEVTYRSSSGSATGYGTAVVQ